MTKLQSLKLGKQAFHDCSCVVVEGAFFSLH